MNRLAVLRAVVLAVLALAASPSCPYAQERGRSEASTPAHHAAPAEAIARRPPPTDAVSRHEITIGGRKLAYTATAGTLPLTDAKGETTADVFYVSFMLDGVSDRSRRPITYLFNGGPGASSAYLDIGAIGPRALAFGPDGALPPPGARVADNPDTWLPFTDLVFIDPVGTGYSRATGGEEAAAKEFWGVGQDLEALGDIIRLHLAKSGRVSSPVYLVGESYGGFRAARLAYDLDLRRGIALDGVVMVSPVIDFGLMSGDPLDPLPFALRLPSYAAARLGAKSLDPGALDAAEQFALHDYLVTLVAGPHQGAEATPFYDKLAQLTGIDVASLKLWRGRIPIDNYLRDMDRRDGRVVSRYDATVSVTDPNPWSPGANDDPVLDRSIAPFTTAFIAYARDELGFKTEQPYELLNGVAARHWDWRSGRGGSFRRIGASDSLRRALALEPRLRVMIAHGVTDLQTPFMMSRYIKDQMPAPLGNRIAVKLYAGGHMLYLHESSRHQLYVDAKSFYAAATAE
ncbi:MAG TPA: septum formation initiator [Stellaceae bacterium]|nr:septum formation initiator [Stellaceae bacterium]